MIVWAVVVMLIALVFVFLGLKHMKHKILAVVVILLIMFLYITGSRIIKSGEADVKSFDGVMHIIKVYFSWLVDVSRNLKDIAGSAIKMDWEIEANQTGK